MKVSIVLVLVSIFLLISACQPREPICSPDSITRIADAPPFPTHASPIKTDGFLKPVEVEINGKTMLVDQLVNGTLCEGNWSGTVYVGCDIQIAAWEGEADFLQGCDLEIEPGTVVYVAAHDDEPYYKGCSCHTGEDPIE
jgi:hypothetical protein